ncbi:20682_t:CDS:1, partial [Cetraspora pellucida]
IWTKRLCPIKKYGQYGHSPYLFMSNGPYCPCPYLANTEFY